MAARVRVIGPLMVLGDDCELVGGALGGTRERRLLAILAVATGGLVSKDAIIDRLWDRQPQNRSRPSTRR